MQSEKIYAAIWKKAQKIRGGGRMSIFDDTPQSVWNWIDISIGGRENRKWEDAPRGKYFIANADVEACQL